MSTQEFSPLCNTQTTLFSYQTLTFIYIELEEREIIPDGIISDGNIGHSADFDMPDITGNKINS